MIRLSENLVISFGFGNHGLNFTTGSWKNPIKDLVYNNKNAIFELRSEKVEESKQECVVLIRNVKLPKHNIDMDEAIVLKNPREDKEIMVIKVEKGNATVIINRSNYEEKTLDHLLNNKSYKNSVEPPPIKS